MADAIRVCTSDDIPAVADLFQRTFRDTGAPASDSLRAYLRELFLEHPWAEPDLASRVYVTDAGKVGGFIGVLPLRMTLGGRKVRAAVAGSLMVHRPRENPLVGARLLRGFVAGPQDISISETANTVSQGMWERLGDRPQAAYSMDWLRVLRPGGFAVALARDGFSPARLLGPVGWLVDAVAERMRSNLLRPAPFPDGTAEDVDADDADLIRLMPDLAAAYTLRPDWDADALGWFLTHAAQKERHGPLFRRAVHGKGGVLGCYLYYGRPRGIGWVLQILARPDAVGTVVDSLFAHAYAHGCVAVRGRAHPMIAEALLRRRCLFYRHASTIIHTRHAELRAVVETGDALLVGLAGEAWTRLIGGRFA